MNKLSQKSQNNSNNDELGYSSTYLNNLANAARFKSIQMARKIGLSNAEQEDLYQEITLKGLEVASKYDQSRGQESTFIGQIANHRSSEFIDQTIKDRMKYCASALNADELNDEFESVSVQTICDSKIHDINACSTFDFMHDFEIAMLYMNAEQAQLISLLAKNQSISEACAASGMKSSTFYRHVDELKMHLRMFGLEATT